ncbi:MAG TPA: hypothetical protein VGD59_05985 [Acidisarcina sp.]
MEETLKSKNARHLLTIVTILMSAHYSAADLNLTTPEFDWDDYTHLRLHVGPFDYRMLPALIWRLLAWLLGPLHRSHPGLNMPMLHQPFLGNRGWFLFLLGFFFMLATLTVARGLLQTINPAWQFGWLALSLGYIAYFDTALVLNRNLYYPYDVPALFFFTLLVSLAWRDRPLLFTLVLAVATLNKETACMSILIYFGLHIGRTALGRLAALCAGMAATVLAVRLAERALIHHVCSTCTAQAQHQLSGNIAQLANPFFWLSATSVFGYAYVAVILLWRYIPVRLRITASVTYVAWLGGMSVVGILRELRIFSELSALLLLLVAVGLNEWMRQRETLRPSPACPVAEA